MKQLILYLFIVSGITTNAQSKIIYKELIAAANEVALTDSIHFNECPEEFIPLDSNLVKSIFKPLYHLPGKNWGISLSWSLAGKISCHTDYDLLLLIEQNQGKDSLHFNTLHLVTMSKDGEYIAAFGLVINRSSKYSSYNTSSFLYKDLSIIQNTSILASQKRFGGTHEYRINEAGKFVYYARN